MGASAKIAFISASVNAGVPSNGSLNISGRFTINNKEAIKIPLMTIKIPAKIRAPLGTGPFSFLLINSISFFTSLDHCL